MALHQRLVLRLPEAPTSGYRWRGAEALGAEAALRLRSSNYAPPSPGAVGGQGVLCLVFEARASGRVDLHLRQVRAGATGAPAAQFTLTVQVSA